MDNFNKNKLYAYRWGIGFIALCASILLSLFIADRATSGTNPWGDTLRRNESRCEFTYWDDLMREKANAYSNLSFLFCGIYCLFGAYLDYTRPNQVSGQRAYNIGQFASVQAIVGLSMCYLGYGSGHYHACAGKCPYGGFMDISGIFVVIFSLLIAATILVLMNFGFVSPLNSEERSIMTNKSIVIACWVFWISSMGISFNYDAVFPSLEVMKIPMVGLFCLLLSSLAAAMFAARRRNFRANYDYILVPLSFSCLIISVAAWVPEEIFGECADSGGLELHAIWHSFLGMSIFFAIVYARVLGRPMAVENGFWSVVLFMQDSSMQKGFKTSQALDIESPADPAL